MTMRSYYDFLSQAAAETPDKEALVCGNRRVCYRALDSLSEGLAGLLAARGIGPGDRVAVFATKDIEEVAAIFAIARIGAVMVHINPSFRAQHVAHVVRDCSVAAMLVHADRARVLAAAFSEDSPLKVIVSLSSPTPKDLDGLGDVASFAQIQQTQWSSLPTCAARTVQDLAAIVYTSGSTGMPKGIMVSHEVFIEATTTCAAVLRNHAGDRILSATPFSFDGALSQLFTACHVRATLVLQRSNFPNDIVATLLAERITGFHAVPSLWNMLLGAHSSLADNAYPDLRYVTIIGETFQPERFAELRRVLARTQFHMMYGTTEAFRSTCLMPDELDRRPASVGRPLPGVEISIVEDGRRCAPGEVGEIVHSGAFVASGYWNNPDKSAEVFRNGRVHTGDLGKLDEDGYLYFVGRKDGMIKTNGFRVSPDEVEQSLHRLAGVREAAVVAVVDPAIGYAIKAFVACAPDVRLDEAAVISYCRRQLAHYMVPASVEFRDELPKTSSGKLDRSALRAD